MYLSSVSAEWNSMIIHRCLVFETKKAFRLRKPTAPTQNFAKKYLHCLLKNSIDTTFPIPHRQMITFNFMSLLTLSAVLLLSCPFSIGRQDCCLKPI